MNKKKICERNTKRLAFALALAHQDKKQNTIDASDDVLSHLHVYHM